MGGEGNKCGQAVESDVDQTFFANLYNIDTDPGMTGLPSKFDYTVPFTLEHEF
jgi:hypothetical protein